MYRLLQAPFDFSLAFNEALKRIIVALPNRPAKESSDDAVRRQVSYYTISSDELARYTIVRTPAASANSHAILAH